MLTAQDAQAIAKAFTTGNVSFEADPNQARLAAYKKSLAQFDWNFEFSDDSRVYRQAKEALKALHAEQAVVDPLGTTWTTYLTERFGAAHGFVGPRVGIFAVTA